MAGPMQACLKVVVLPRKKSNTFGCTCQNTAAVEEGCSFQAGEREAQLQSRRDAYLFFAMVAVEKIVDTNIH